jgi:pimeloyl-ACP methyl ester carboxylesterase
MIRLLSLSLLILLNFSCAAVEPATSLPRAHSRVDLKPCRFPNHESESLCGKYFVYENRAARTGRMIGLNILIIPALTTKPAADPVFFFAGGPGQGAARIARAGEDSLMRDLRRTRDLVFIDQRGTGDSNSLLCPARADRASLQSYFRDIFDPELIAACREFLKKQADLKFYTTFLAIDDIEEIRRALGYGMINLSGISYGTLTALEYLRHYPSQVRAVLLAGVTTPAAKLPLYYAQGAQRAMNKLIEDCAADESCRSAYPALENDLAAALRAFTAGPVSFELSHPATKVRQTVTLSRGVFSERLRLMLYHHHAASLIPLMLHRAAHGDWLPFAQFVIRTRIAPAYSLALGTYLSITCSEAGPFIDAAEISRETSNTFLGDYRALRHRSACEEWPRGDIPHDFFLPIKSDVPVLMLSGDSDPATPMDFGKAAVPYLSNGRQIVLRHTAHSYTSDCARALATQFIAAASMDHLDASCSDKMRRPRFLTELPE